MIARSATVQHIPDWQQQLKQAISDIEELLDLLGLDRCLLPAAELAARKFPLRVPHSFVARMKKGDADDPLLRQVLPLGIETEQTPGYTLDPVGDLNAMPQPGLLHKYQGRILLLTTGACAIHCRYCFRRHFPYAEANPLRNDWSQALDYIASDPSIHEIILSGGDPLVLSDRRLAQLGAALENIAHVRCIRIHTRLPIVLPDRIGKSLLGWLNDLRLHKVIVIHSNHANELDDSVARALSKLASTGAMLLNQTVLLRGINDNAKTLSNLSNALFEIGVLPYYLHLLDRVQGSAHFDVNAKRACALVETLNDSLPGYLVPRLVREQSGALGKSPVN
ncbi:MAG: EF-P beta-lysylation protein EpmB [Gammaproteobacteria bacterium]|nr:EF-P beta-lysylation protein EpmB [Gammaproteobacteria bacterium]